MLNSQPQALFAFELPQRQNYVNNCLIGNYHSFFCKHEIVFFVIKNKRITIPALISFWRMCQAFDAINNIIEVNEFILQAYVGVRISRKGYYRRKECLVFVLEYLYPVGYILFRRPDIAYPVHILALFAFHPPHGTRIRPRSPDLWGIKLVLEDLFFMNVVEYWWNQFPVKSRNSRSILYRI